MLSNLLRTALRPECLPMTRLLSVRPTDCGVMNPFQHGEVYVTDDGAETDLDLGHYERFLGVPMRNGDFGLIDPGTGA